MSTAEHGTIHLRGDPDLLTDVMERAGLRWMNTVEDYVDEFAEVSDGPLDGLADCWVWEDRMRGEIAAYDPETGRFGIYECDTARVDADRAEAVYEPRDRDRALLVQEELDRLLDRYGFEQQGGTWDGDTMVTEFAPPRRDGAEVVVRYGLTVDDADAPASIDPYLLESDLFDGVRAGMVDRVTVRIGPDYTGRIPDVDGIHGLVQPDG